MSCHHHLLSYQHHQKHKHIDNKSLGQLNDVRVEGKLRKKQCPFDCYCHHTPNQLSGTVDRKIKFNGILGDIGLSQDFHHVMFIA